MPSLNINRIKIIHFLPLVGRIVGNSYCITVSKSEKAYVFLVDETDKSFDYNAMATQKYCFIKFRIIICVDSFVSLTLQK